MKQGRLVLGSLTQGDTDTLIVPCAMTARTVMQTPLGTDSEYAPAVTAWNMNLWPLVRGRQLTTTRLVELACCTNGDASDEGFSHRCIQRRFNAGHHRPFLAQVVGKRRLYLPDLRGRPFEHDCYVTWRNRDPQEIGRVETAETEVSTANPVLLLRRCIGVLVSRVAGQTRSGSGVTCTTTIVVMNVTFNEAWGQLNLELFGYRFSDPDPRVTIDLPDLGLEERLHRRAADALTAAWAGFRETCRPA